MLGDSRSLKELIEVSKMTENKCDVCGMPIWRYGHGNETGLCFTCTTGEADSSEDYELLPPTKSGGESPAKFDIDQM
jgi:uncharacterized Zn finger protein (UPF0148 family)